MKNFSIKAEHIFFALILILYLLYSSKLGLYLDDANFVFPSVSGNIAPYIQSQIQVFGVARILSHFYLQPLFFLYTLNSAVAHAIPVILYVYSMFLLHKILIKQKMDPKIAFTLVAVVSAIPFSVEIIGWLSASHGMLVICLFLVQIYLIETYAKLIKTLYLVVFLQILSVLLYETTILTPIALTYLYLVRSGKFINNFTRNLLKYFAYLLILIFPSFAYVILRKLFAPPASYDKLSGLAPMDLFSNLFVATDHTFKFLQYNHFNSFVQEIWILGLNSVTNNFLVLGIFVAILGIFFHLIILRRDSEATSVNNPNLNSTLVFWTFSLFVLFGAISFQKFYFSFRLLFLPALIISIILGFFLNHLKKFAIMLWLILYFILLTLQIGLFEGYRLQYAYDQAIIKELRIKTENLGFNSQNRVNVLIKDFPSSQVVSEVYGDYLYSIFRTSWSAEAFIDLNSASLKNFALENKDENLFISKIPEAEFYKLSPLAIFSYNNNENCLVSDCLEIIEYESK